MKNNKDMDALEKYSIEYYKDRSSHDIDIQAFIDRCQEKDELYANSMPYDRKSKFQIKTRPCQRK